jgi:hypothetical protein
LLARRWVPDSYRTIARPTLVIVALTQALLFPTADGMRSAIAQTKVATLGGQRPMATAFDPTGSPTPQWPSRPPTTDQTRRWAAGRQAVSATNRRVS